MKLGRRRRFVTSQDGLDPLILFDIEECIRAAYSSVEIVLGSFNLDSGCIFGGFAAD